MPVINPAIQSALQRAGQVADQRESRAIPAPSAPASSGEAGGSDFAKALEDAIGEIDATQRVADDKSMALVTGQEIPVHEVMAAVTEAELAVQMTTAVATKAIAAYQEIWRMDV